MKKLMTIMMIFTSMMISFAQNGVSTKTVAVGENGSYITQMSDSTYLIGCSYNSKAAIIHLDKNQTDTIAVWTYNQEPTGRVIFVAETPSHDILFIAKFATKWYHILADYNGVVTKTVSTSYSNSTPLAVTTNDLGYIIAARNPSATQITIASYSYNLIFKKSNSVTPSVTVESASLTTTPSGNIILTYLDKAPTKQSAVECYDKNTFAMKWSKGVYSSSYDFIPTAVTCSKNDSSIAVSSLKIASGDTVANITFFTCLGVKTNELDLSIGSTSSMIHDIKNLGSGNYAIVGGYTSGASKQMVYSYIDNSTKTSKCVTELGVSVPAPGEKLIQTLDTNMLAMANPKVSGQNKIMLVSIMNKYDKKDTTGGVVLGVNKMAAKKLAVTVYPNPSTVGSTVKFTGDVAQVTVFNLMGQQVLNVKGGEIAIENAGVYMYQVKDAKGNIGTGKLVIQ